MKKIKVINEWMQELKLRVYNADTYEQKIKELESEYEEIQGSYDILNFVYKNSKKRFIIKCILTFGILYVLKKDKLKDLDDIIEESKKIVDEEEDRWKNKKQLLERDKSFKSQNIRYYEQMEQFFNLINNMNNDEKAKYLNYKM